MPIDKAIECANHLREKFYDAMSAVAGDNTPPTLSVGIGISHMMTPMGTQLNLARRAEHLAKSNELDEKQAKNALAIILQPRSGAEISYRERWDARPKAAHTIMQQWAKVHELSLLPRQVAYNLRDAAIELSWCEEDDGDYQHVIQNEAIRILNHKKTIKEDKPEKEQIVSVLERIAKQGLSKTADELMLSHRIYQASKLAKVGGS